MAVVVATPDTVAGPDFFDTFWAIGTSDQRAALHGVLLPLDLNPSRSPMIIGNPDRASPVRSEGRISFRLLKLAVNGLATIRRFSNADKHRLIHAARTNLTAKPVLGANVTIAANIREVIYQNPGATLEDGAEVARYRPTSSSPSIR